MISASLLSDYQVSPAQCHEKMSWLKMARYRLSFRCRYLAMALVSICTLVLLKSFIGTGTAISQNRSFVIDYENDRFLKDGQPFQYISAGIHYFRVPREYWEDRLIRIRSAGANTVGFYIPWNFHEPTPGNYEWTGDHDLEAFIMLAQKHGLCVIVRAGPYVCGEWEHGGLPWWLLKIPNITLRDYNPVALKEYDKWYSVLLPKLRPLLYRNGGPIILVQVENEYGSYSSCDMKYRLWLRDTFQKYLRNETILFTADGTKDWMLECGHIPGTHTTLNFGPTTSEKADQYFKKVRKYTPRGPLINSEFYPGWLDRWGEKWQYPEIEPIINTTTYLLTKNVSFNFYMFHGGTNFGYWNGAHEGPPFISAVTSYDYDAPLSEAGDATEKFMAIKETIANIIGRQPLIETPPDNPKASYGDVTMRSLGTVPSLLHILSPETLRRRSMKPLSFEEMDFGYGFILYETLAQRKANILSVPCLHDRGYVIQNGGFVGMLQRDQVVNASLQGGPVGKLQILVENMGRINFNLSVDPKGILGPVLLDGVAIKNWTMYPIQLENIFRYLDDEPERSQKLYQNAKKTAPYQPSLFHGTFRADDIADTFFDPTGWGKGQLFINGYNLGRYWPTVGPQITLYIPKHVLRSQNTVILLELDQPGQCSGSTGCSVSFIDYPMLNGTVIEPVDGLLDEYGNSTVAHACDKIYRCPKLAAVYKEVDFRFFRRNSTDVDDCNYWEENASSIRAPFDWKPMLDEE